MQKDKVLDILHRTYATRKKRTTIVQSKVQKFTTCTHL